MTLSTLFLFTIALMLAAAQLSLSCTTLRIANRRAYNQQAMSLAITGAEHAIAGFRSNSSFMAVNQQDTYTISGPGGGTITLTCARVNSVTQVTSTSQVTGALGTITKTVSVSINPGGGSVPPYRYPISSKNNLTISGGTQTTSWPTAGAGSVYTNGNLSISGSTTRIDGNAIAAGTISVGGSPLVTGTKQSGADTLSFQDVDQTFEKQALSGGTTTGDTTFSSGAGQFISGKYVGNVTISGSGCSIANGAVVWITGNLTLNGPVLGTGTIVVDGTITAAGGSYSSATNVLFISMYPRTSSNPTATAPATTAISISGNSTCYGFFYAPYAQLSVSGGANVFGGISAMAVTITGRALITVPNDNRTLPPAPGNGTSGWEEL